MSELCSRGDKHCIPYQILPQQLDRIAACTIEKAIVCIFFHIFGGLVPGFVCWVLGIVSWVLGIVFWVLGIVVWVLGIVFWVSGLVFWVSGLVFWVSGLVFWVSAIVFWVSGLECRGAHATCCPC